MNNKKMGKPGFSLIELLVVISILAVLMSISVFAIQGARRASRDATRKTDLETIRSALELYKADCGVYPASLSYGNQLAGTETTGNTCLTSDVYMEEIPNDMLTSQIYSYKPTTSGYVICAHLEGGATTADAKCQSESANCGDGVCNISVVNP